MRKYLSILTLLTLIFFLYFTYSTKAEEFLSEITVTDGELVMYFVDDGGQYISEPSSVLFEAGETLFGSLNVRGIFGTSEQQLRIENGIGREVALTVALDVSNFAEDAKWVSGAQSFLAYSTDGEAGGLLVDPENVILNDDNCGEVLNNRMPSRFTYLGPGDPGNVESIDVLNTLGGSYCSFDLRGLLLVQAIPSGTPARDYELGMVLTLSDGGEVPTYTVTYDGNSGVCEPVSREVSFQHEALAPSCVLEDHIIENFEVVTGSCSSGWNSSTGYCADIREDITIRANWVDKYHCYMQQSYDGGINTSNRYNFLTSCPTGFDWSEISSDPEIWMDNITGLYWTAELTSGINWYDAVDYCDVLLHADREDWRIPTKDELMQVVPAEHAYSYKGGNDMLGNTGESFTTEVFWSRNVVPNATPDPAWRVNLSSGYVDYNSLTATNTFLRVRCVTRD